MKYLKWHLKKAPVAVRAELSRLLAKCELIARLRVRPLMLISVEKVGNPTWVLWVGVGALRIHRTICFNAFLLLPCSTSFWPKPSSITEKGKKLKIPGLEGSPGDGTGFGELQEGRGDPILLSACRGVPPACEPWHGHAIGWWVYHVSFQRANQNKNTPNSEPKCFPLTRVPAPRAGRWLPV